MWLFGNKKKSNSRFRSRAPMTRKEKLLKLAQSDAYYSVTITRAGCPASSQLISKCFLFEDVPTLPLPNCNANKCTCEFQGVLNRRKKERRISNRRMSIRMDSDRRQVGRRKGETTWNNYGI